MKFFLHDLIGLLKLFLGTVSAVLILFGIHWLIILTGVVLGICYLMIPNRYLA